MIREPIKLVPKKPIDPAKLRPTQRLRCHNRRCLRLYRPKQGGALFCCTGCQKQHALDTKGAPVSVKGLHNALNAHHNPRSSPKEPSGCTCSGAKDAGDGTPLPGRQSEVAGLAKSTPGRADK